MAHLLAISLGPVQEFIAAARKTRDLWSGSALLSQAARAAAERLRQAGADLIFPAPDALDDRAVAVANKVLAIIDGPAPAALADAARQAAVALLQQRVAAVTAALEQLSPAARRAVDRPLLDQQIAQFLEFYSAWVAFDPATGDYPAARRDVERLLAGRKALRDFGPPAGGAGQRDGRPKSALDPSRESVILDRDPAVCQQLRIRPNEHLDGVSLVKRRAQAPRFVSVVRVAVDPLIRRLARDEPDTLARLNELADRLQGSGAAERFPADGAGGLAQYAAFPYDTLLFFDETGDDEDLTDPDDLRRASEFHDLARQACRRLGVGEPPGYYAVLHADGDRMGRVIGAMTTPAAHRALSRALARFAGRAGAIVVSHQGALIYSGGDDVLALLPVDTALACADALRRAFVEVVQPVVGAGIPVSLSVGVAVVHYREALLDALDYARAAEAMAKQPRAALAVALHTRSGGADATAVVAPWADDPAATFRDWVALHRADAIPNGAIYELRALRLELARAPLSDDGRRDLLRREVERILRRKRVGRGQAPLAGTVIDEIGRQAGGDLAALGRVVNALIIARRLADAATVAAGPGLPAGGRA